MKESIFLHGKQKISSYYVNKILESGIYLTWINFRVDKILRFREFFGFSQKLIHAKFLRSGYSRKLIHAK